MPGWSTHCDANHISPVIDWEQIMNATYSERNINQSINLSYL